MRFPTYFVFTELARAEQVEQRAAAGAARGLAGGRVLDVAQGAALGALELDHAPAALHVQAASTPLVDGDARRGGEREAPPRAAREEREPPEERGRGDHADRDEQRGGVGTGLTE